MTWGVSYPNIDTMYGKYLRGKIKAVPPGLPAYEFYGMCSAIEHEINTEKSVPSAGSEKKRRIRVSDTMLSAGRKTTYYDSLLPEMTWVISSRVEYRPSLAFCRMLKWIDLPVTAAQAMMSIAPLSDQSDERALFSARLVPPRETAMSINGMVGAYVVIMTTKAQADEVKVVVKIATITSPNPLDTELMHTGRDEFSPSTTIDDEIPVYVTGCVSEGSGIEAAFSLASYFRLAFIVMVLTKVNHRILTKERTVSQALNRGLVHTIISVGRDLKMPPEDREPDVRGRIYWEADGPGSKDGQLLIEWPQWK